jgi:two-component system, NtrC family, sensor histidine kinase KinB
VNPQFRLRLFFKAALLLVGLATVPLAIVGTQILRSNRDIHRHDVLRHHAFLAQSLANLLDSQLDGLDEKLRFAVSSVQSAQLTWPEKQSLLQSLVDSSPQFAVISVVAEDGREILKVYNPEREPTLAAFPALSSHEGEPLFQLLSASTGRVMAVSPGQADPRLTLYFPMPTPTGRHAIFISYSLKTFWDELTATRVGETGYCFLVDKDGRILAHPDQAKAGARESVRSTPIVMAALAGNSAASEFRENDELWIGASAPVKKLGGAVVTMQSRAEAFVAVSRSEHTALLWLLISALLAAVIAFLFARQLTRPILALIQASQEVNLETGQFPADVAVARRDEIGELVDTFNAMTRKLRGYAALQLERLLREKTKTEAIILSMGDGLVMTDREGVIEFINNRAREFLDISADPSALLGKPLWNFLPHAEILDPLWDMAHHPQDNKTKEIDITAGPYRKVLSVRSEPVLTPKGKDIGIIIILRDVTLEKQIEQMKDDFLHSITHDLRNPMTSIRGFLKFLMDELGGPLTEQQRKMLETMDRASIRLLGMINDILDVAKLEAGKIELHLADVDLRDTVKHVTELLQTQANKKKIQLKMDAPASFPAVQADALLMERLFTNLIGNAIKFTFEEGSITVELRDEPTRIYAAVVDTGEGIPPEYVDKIFDKFQQVAGQRKGGTGLGLTICRYIVESHKGEIKVQSEVGRGSRFHFWIPKNLTKVGLGEVAVETSAGPGAA